MNQIATTIKQSKKLIELGIDVNTAVVDNYGTFKNGLIIILKNKTMDYEKNVCPYDVGQLLTTKEVLNWIVDQDTRLHGSYTSTIINVIDDTIMNEVIRQLRIKRLEDYTTSELEQELELRKSK